MPQTSIYVLASLVSGVSAALILASGSSYTEARSPQGTAHHFKGGWSTCHGGGDGCRSSSYQIANLNSAEDFCLWAPSQPALPAAEHALVAWCLKGAHSTHLIPDSAIWGAHLLITPEYVQITGVGNLTRINVPFDGVASASGGDRFHSLVFTSAYGQPEQVHDWTSFVSQDRFCFRACRPSATASTACPPVQDILGCAGDVLGAYDEGTFEDCVGDAMKAPSTLFQGVLTASSHDAVRPLSSCTIRRVVGDARATHARRTVACTPDCTTPSSTSSLTPTPSSDNATTITFPSLPMSTSSSTTCTDSSMSCSTTTAYSNNNTCTLSSSHWHPHYHPFPTFAYPSPSPSNASSSNSDCWMSTSSDPLLTSSTSSPTPSFTPAVPGYSSSDPLSFGTSPSISTSVSAFTSTPVSTYGSSDPLPPVTSPPASSPASTSMTLSTPTSYSSFSYDTSLPFPDPSSLSSSCSITSPMSSLSSSSSSLSSFILSSSTSSLIVIPPSPSESSSSPTSSQSPLVPPLISPSLSPSESSQSPYVPTISASPTPSSSAFGSSSVPTPSLPSPFPSSQTQLGSQCPPVSLAVNSASRPIIPLLMLAISAIASLLSML